MKGGGRRSGDLSEEGRTSWWLMAFSPLIGGIDVEGCRQSVITWMVMPLLLATCVIVGGELGD